MGERGETLMRIIVLVITGIILAVWKYLIFVFVVINFIWTLISGKRIRDVAELSEIWNTQKYVFVRYIVFLSNKRPFPFTKLERSMSKYSR